MTDPVIALFFTYKRAAVEQWLKENNSSPQSNQELSKKYLIPNHTLKMMILEQVWQPQPLS
jgi:hypothetical protein